MYSYPLSNHLGSLKNLFESVCAFMLKSEFAKKKKRKLKYLEKILTKQEQEPTTNIWH